MILKRRYERIIREPLRRRWLSIFLLSLYCSTIAAPVAHTWAHHAHEHDEHSALNELDPCHRAIYHRDGGCKHKSHVAKSDKCWFCDVHFLTDYLAVSLLMNVVVSVKESHPAFCVDAFYFFRDHHSSRGPPMQ